MSLSGRYTDGTYLEGHADWHEQDAGWKGQAVARILRRNNLTPDSICDVGCGTGGVLAQLRREFPETSTVVGYELSPQAIEMGRQLHPEVEFHRTQGGTLPDDFEILLALDVFEHVEDYLGFLRSLRGSATHYVFHIPLDMNVQMVARCKPVMRNRDELGHLHYFSRETALATLEDSGFQAVDELYTPGALIKPGSVKAKIATLPRRAAFAVSPHLAVRVLGGYSLLVLAIDGTPRPSGDLRA